MDSGSKSSWTESSRKNPKKKKQGHTKFLGSRFAKGSRFADYWVPTDEKKGGIFGRRNFLHLAGHPADFTNEL